MIRNDSTRESRASTFEDQLRRKRRLGIGLSSTIGGSIMLLTSLPMLILAVMAGGVGIIIFVLGAVAVAGLSILILGIKTLVGGETDEGGDALGNASGDAL